tara:strand:- start:185 stop:1282 length:1098 start_codon:yes stop_codon:yes gene_type:complete
MASLADTGAYLDQLYQEKFGREPDAAGKAYWQAEIDSGKTSPDRVAALFDSSDEAKQIKADKEAETQKFIEDTYKIELDREPDTAGANYWAEQINSGKETQQDVVNNIRQSQEYQAVQADPASDSTTEGAGLNHEDWLEDQYQSILKRDVGDEGRDYWLGELGNGQSRAEVKANIERSNEKWLGDQYRELFGRDLDDEGRAYWMGDFRGKGSGREDLTYGQDERPVQTREQVLANLKLHLNEDGEEIDPNDPDDSDDGGTGKAYDERYEKLKSDYDDLRRTYDSEFGDKRDFATSRLTTGFTVGGFPGSRRDLRSGSTATSDRSRKRSMITAGPKVKDDRPYAREGIKSGSERGSTYFDPASSFR